MLDDELDVLTTPDEDKVLEEAELTEDVETDDDVVLDEVEVVEV